ncbi:putative amidohydrolase [Amycolatopsis bartoniae]|uniref:Amidohydrolase n=1 Tax=Amycolatopsis bartoniae TaxID=941986 RepID=A0A8H9MFK8_9PSEU|nr:carbon-nitrogen hydrolase family protein [Amycolatopsis bartoniae]MBB2939387.1 putative amidohydrolase [Amycolatopsis bartoniae]TVT06692.1 carbon-nitrogen hydrolase family protein [Amycolatopsis bartoniae]GHF83391.1 amidohydrolase [Amycolatopsis bartoniae]
MGRPLTLALAQVSAGRDLAGFAAHASATVHRFPGTRLLAYPELHLTAESDVDSAEPLTDGPRHRYFAELAGDLGLWLCPGSVAELGDDGHVYDTAVVYSPEGELAASYRKVFPWRPHEPFRPGREFVVFPIPGVGRVGLSVCYDAWFPETTRHLAWLGAELVLNVVRTDTADRAQEVVLARANAIVNQVFVASVNAAGPTGVGHSVLTGPEGQVLAELPGGTEEVLTAVIDLDVVTAVRRHGSFGVTKPWEQLREDDEPIPLPLYGGALTASRWRASPSVPVPERT